MIVTFAIKHRGLKTPSANWFFSQYFFTAFVPESNGACFQVYNSSQYFCNEGKAVFRRNDIPGKIRSFTVNSNKALRGRYFFSRSCGHPYNMFRHHFQFNGMGSACIYRVGKDNNPVFCPDVRRRFGTKDIQKSGNKQTKQQLFFHIKQSLRYYCKATFEPFTTGHSNVAECGLKCCGLLIINRFCPRAVTGA